MRAVILAGGQGTRLRPYTTVLPKPLVPVGDRPILELIVHQLARAGVTQVDLCVGHLGELIRAYFEEGPALPDGISLNYIWEDEPLGTAGALHQIEPPDEPFLVMNGDILTKLDYAELVRFHTERDSAMTIASHLKNVDIALGVIESDEEVVTGYIEKPTLGYEVSMGIYVYDPRALEHIPKGHFDFPDLVLKLVAEGERVLAYRYAGPWFDIGTTEEHERAVTAYQADPERFDA
jgi:NDP-sugar pyrophosphorylase family protein